VLSSHVTVLAAGLCTLKASQAGNGNWTAAPPVDASFLVTYNVSKLSPAPRTKLKRGSTLRVAFQLTGANGRLLPRSVATKIACPAATATFNGPPRVCLVYDARTNYFQANIKTSSHLTVGAIYKIAITVVVVTGKIRRTVASARTSVRIIS
jgi:hypothetical protein